MNRLFDYLRNKHGLWFKLAVFLCSLFFIVWLLPSPNASSISYELGKPWQNEDLVAPFDFAVYKTDADVQAEQNRARNIDQRQQPRALAHELALLRKSENEVQEQRGLQDSGGDVAPINRPVEIVQLAGVLE